jgi:dCMP deaminase
MENNKIERIGRVRLNMEIAELLSLRSSCKRARVGCVITNMSNRIISTGYNEAPSGQSECNCILVEGYKCIRTIHAETNAIYAAAKEGISLLGANLHCTYSPCDHCAKAIIQSGIKNIIFKFEYRDLEPLKLLKEANITIGKIRGDYVDTFKI